MLLVVRSLVGNWILDTTHALEDFSTIAMRKKKPKCSLILSIKSQMHKDRRKRSTTTIP